MDACAEQLEEEVGAYHRAASAEEERALLLSNVLSRNAEAHATCDDEDDAIRG